MMIILTTKSMGDLFPLPMLKNGKTNTKMLGEKCFNFDIAMG